MRGWRDKRVLHYMSLHFPCLPYTHTSLLQLYTMTARFNTLLVAYTALAAVSLTSPLPSLPHGTLVDNTIPRLQFPCEWLSNSL